MVQRALRLAEKRFEDIPRENRDVGMKGSTLLAVVAALALLAGWSAVQSAGQDIAVLRTFDFSGVDLYTTLWSLDDGRTVWIRANRPDREWLAQMRRNPDVELKRRGRNAKFRALLFERMRSEAYVEAGFREKYALADRWREWTNGNDTILVQLKPR